MLRPIAGFPASENLVIVGKFARWASSRRREDIPLELGFKKWKYIYLSGLESHFREQFELCLLYTSDAADDIGQV